MDVGISYDIDLCKSLVIRPFLELSEYTTSEHFTTTIGKNAICTLS